MVNFDKISGCSRSKGSIFLKDTRGPRPENTLQFRPMALSDRDLDGGK
jgi:hypothetical protein